MSVSSKSRAIDATMSGQHAGRILRDNSILLIFIIMCIGISLLTGGRFLTAYNLINVIRQVSITAIVATGMTFVILTGGIDLSVGSVIAVSGCVIALLLKQGWSVVSVLLIGLVVGLVAGLVNGLLVAKGELPPFIATLASMTFLRGLALLITGGYPIGLWLPEFKWIGSGYLAGIPVPIWIMVLTITIMSVILRRTRFGKYVYAIGGNTDAARLSGINVDKILILVYGLCGLFSGLGGAILAARITSGQPTAGTGYEMDVIASVIVGGTSLSGGQGTLRGTVIGAFIMGILSNGMNILNISAYWQYLTKATVIVIAVLMDVRSKKHA